MKCKVLLLALLLASCSAKPLTDTLVNNANNSVQTLEKVLPSECKTDSVIALTGSIKAQINAISESCKTEKQVLNQKIKIRELIIGVLFLILLLTFRKKIL